MSLTRTLRATLFSSVFVLLTGNFFYAGCQWLLMTSLVKSSSVSLLGFYSYSLSILAPVIAIGNMGLRSLLARDSVDEYNASDFLKLRVLCFAVAVGLLLVTFGMTSDNYEFLLIIFLVAVAKMAEACSDICYGAMQKLNRGALHGISLILRCALAILLFSVFWHIADDVRMGFAGIGVSWFVVLLFFDMPQSKIGVKDVFVRVSRDDLRHYLKVAQRSVPIVVTALVGSVLVAVPNYSIERVLGFETLGYYTSIFCFSVAMNMVGTTFGQAALTRLSRLHNNGETSKFYRKVFADIFLILMAASIFVFTLVIWGRPILAVTFGDKVSVMHMDLPIVVALSIPMFIAQYLSYAVTATAEYASITRVTIFALVVSTILAYQFVSDFGLVGAAMLTFITGSIQVLGFARTLLMAMGTSDRARFA